MAQRAEGRRRAGNPTALLAGEAATAGPGACPPPRISAACARPLASQRGQAHPSPPHLCNHCVTSFSLNISPLPPQPHRDPTIFFSISFFSSFLFSAKLILSLSCHKITSENTTSLQKKSRMTQTLRKTHCCGLWKHLERTPWRLRAWGEGSGESPPRTEEKTSPYLGGSQLALGQPQSQH